MKRNIIILIALIVLFALPVLAKPMVAVTNPINNENFILSIYEINDEIMCIIIGNKIQEGDIGAVPITLERILKAIGTEVSSPFKTENGGVSNFDIQLLAEGFGTSIIVIQIGSNKYYYEVSSTTGTMILIYNNTSK